MSRSLMWRLLGAVLVVCALGLGCSGSDSPTAPRVPADIVLIPNQPKLPQGLSLKLNATVVDASGRAIAGKTVSFSSADSSIVTVDAAGNLHSVGPLGSVRVTAGLDGLTNFVDVEVTQRIVSLAVTPESLVINRQLYASLSVTLKDFQGNSVYAPQVSFSSSDSTIVSVGPFGDVQAHDKLAKATVRVEVDSFHVDVPVRVAAIPASITTNPLNVVLAPSATQQLTVVVRDLANLVITSPALTFTSNAPNLFTVSNTGLITAGTAGGGGTVTVKVDSLQQQVGVFVGSAVPVALTHTTNTATALYEAEIGPGGQLIVSAPDAGKLYRGTLPGSTLPVSFPVGGQPLGVAVNHAGTRGYVATNTSVHVIDLTIDAELPPIPVPGGGAKVGLVVSADDQRAYLGTNVYIYVIDLTTDNVIDSLEVGGGFFLALHPTQPLLYLGDGLVREVNLTTREVRTFGGYGVKDIGVSPDGTELYGADEIGSALRVFSTATGQPIQNVAVQNGAFGIAVSPKYIVVSGGGAATIYDRPSRVLITTVPLGGLTRRPAINAAENTIVVPNELGWLDYIQ